MAEREQKRKQSTTRSDEVVEAVPPTTKQGDKLKAELDELLDEIDEVLEDNAEELFVPTSRRAVNKRYVQAETTPCSSRREAAVSSAGAGRVTTSRCTWIMTIPPVESGAFSVCAATTPSPIDEAPEEVELIRRRALSLPVG